MQHLGIILDGNRRWAKKNGKPKIEGHKAGYENMKKIGEACLKRGIDYVTVFAFSTENWKRSEREVSYLMNLLHNALTKELDFYHEKNIRLKVIGLREGLSDRIVQAIDEAEEKTKNNTEGQLNICINYGGRTEIVTAVKRILDAGYKADDITEDLIYEHTWMHGIPDPDMIIRTSGEKRLSGFLTWSGVYSELYFTDTYWPNFSEEDLDEALDEFERRERRYGK